MILMSYTEQTYGGKHAYKILKNIHKERETSSKENEDEFELIEKRRDRIIEKEIRRVAD